MNTKTVALLAPLLMALALPATVRAAADRAEQLTDTALELDANQRRGGELYRDQCASCHGPLAHGDAKRGIPALAAQRRAYVIKQLADFVEGDRIATQMHKVVARAKVSDPQAWADVSLYVNSLTPPSQVEIGNGKYLSLGEASYVQWCGSCHEEDGRGDDDGYVPSIRNQHYGYLLKETRNLGAGHRFNVENDLSRFLRSLKQDEMEGLADYMSRMHGPVRDRARLNNDGTVSD